MASIILPPSPLQPANQPGHFSFFSIIHTHFPSHKKNSLWCEWVAGMSQILQPKNRKKNLFFPLSLSLSLSLPLSPSLSDRQVSTPKNGRGRKGVERAFLNLLTPILLLLLQKDFFPRFIVRENKRRVRLVDFFLPPSPPSRHPRGFDSKRRFGMRRRRRGLQR